MPHVDKKMSEATFHELYQLARLLSDPHKRKQFAKDPQETLAKNKLVLGNIPPRVVRALADMNHDELRALARLNETLVAAGMRVEGSPAALMIY